VSCVYVLFFFFQAEDGIRDWSVTGVQTCALPIYYKVPTMGDVPVIDAFFVDTADPVANHIGVKGLAEPPGIGIAPAIANAVADEIGRASCRERGEGWGGAGALERKAVSGAGGAGA